MGFNSGVPRNILVWRGIGIIAFVSYCVLLKLSTLDIYDIEFFYWLGIGFHLLLLRLLVFLVVAVAFWYSSKEIAGRWLTFFVVISCFFIFVLVEFTSIFYSIEITHINTIEWNGKTYHLAATRTFDSQDDYHLGVCRIGKFDCRFHHIYTHYVTDGEPELKLSGNNDKLFFLFNGETVYQFDGETGSCVVREYNDCPIDQ